MTARPRLPEATLIPAIAREAAARGGRLLVVGGWVRDQLRGEPSKDLDAEIFGLSQEAVSELLEGFGSIGRVGQHFPIWRLRHRPLDIGYPRDGALEYVADRPTSLETAFQAAARHRDLTLNAIAWDPLDDRCIDPWNGLGDLEAKRLRAVDASTFPSDPVRGLRVARLCARLGAEVEAETLALCRSLDLAALPIERIASELRRILLEPDTPSVALEFLDASGLIEFLPPIAALREVPQDPHWHPEGDVFVHTCLVVDCARRIGRDLEATAREVLQWAALAHDFGKPETTRRDGDRIRSIGHEAQGATIAREWLGSLRIAHQIVTAVEVLVAHHLAPAQFVSGGARPRAYRRLARKLDAGGMSLIDLERLARADHLGRTTDDARAGRFAAGDAFLEVARGEGVATGVRDDLVSARSLMTRGLQPGPLLGRALARAREIQDEQGGSEAEFIVESVLEEFADEVRGTHEDDAEATRSIRKNET